MRSESNYDDLSGLSYYDQISFGDGVKNVLQVLKSGLLKLMLGSMISVVEF